ncbi:MAG: hypothetical protein LC725_07875 [Lentisphaerae bacterium]|nr:hypothetical protein [Lentisphaerota bacterium]
MNDENDFLRDFSLVPDWARQPAAQGVQINVSERARRDPRDRDQGRRPGADRRPLGANTINRRWRPPRPTRSVSFQKGAV